MKNTPNFIKTLVKPNGKGTGRRVWSIDLETVWLPFFTATNTMGDTAIPHEALGAPLRLAYNPDGSAKFSKSGRPVIRVVKEIGDSVRLVRENFIAGLQSYANTVITENTSAYKEQIKLAKEAGAPIIDHDKEMLDEALAKAIQQALAEAKGKDTTEAEANAEANTEAEANAEADTKEKELVQV
jgi:hypothetical protein